MRGSLHDLPTMVVLPDGSAIKHIEWGGMSVEFGAFTNEADPAPFFAGQPDDRCHCHHWGYVLNDELRFKFADRTELFRAGDAHYVGPGHTPLLGDGVEYVEFTPPTGPTPPWKSSAATWPPPASRNERNECRAMSNEC